MQYLYKLSNLQEYVLTNYHEYFETFIYSIGCFFIPLIFRHTQLITGIIVNTLLILAALNIKNYKLLPVIIFPSIGAVTAGLLFGPFTVYLIYLIPFIWIGNSILILSFKHLKLKKKNNYLFTLIISSAAKSLFLFLSAFILYYLGIIPVIFLIAMGVLQLTTAIGGGVVAYGVQKMKRLILA